MGGVLAGRVGGVLAGEMSEGGWGPGRGDE